MIIQIHLLISLCHVFIQVGGSFYIPSFVVTCVWKENLCAWSCLKDEDSRLDEVNALIRGRKPTFSCSPISVLVWSESRFGIQDRNNTNGQDD